MSEWYLSHSPVRGNELRRWFKSIKSQRGIGGEIVANAYGKTKSEAQERAKIIVNANAVLMALNKLTEAVIANDDIKIKEALQEAIEIENEITAVNITPSPPKP